MLKNTCSEIIYLELRFINRQKFDQITIRNLEKVCCLESFISIYLWTLWMIYIYAECESSELPQSACDPLGDVSLELSEKSTTEKL